MNAQVTKRVFNRQLGQSLAETALFMPILLILIAGLVEVSQLVITQNRINTAARNAARFGAQGGENVGMRNVTLNTVTQTLDLTDGMWDVFVVRGELNSDGELPADNFSYEQVYGTGMTEAYTSTTTSQAWEALREEIVDRLSYPGTDPAGLKVVGVLILHDVESILGLDILPALMGRNTIRGFSIMRNSALATTVSQSAGCTGAYPLIIEEGVRSITRAEFDNLTFEYPVAPNVPSYNDFPGHQPDKTLRGGREGYLYKLNVLQGENHDPKTIGLLEWNVNASGTPAEHLVASMTYPGNSENPYYGYVEPGDTTDTELNVGDYILRTDGATGQRMLDIIAPALQDHIEAGRGLRVMLWNVDEHPGSSEFLITGFAVFRIRGYGDEGGPRGQWILLELIRIDYACGQPS